jgi:diguanylate cyclase (GGDEF)-like protein
LRQESESKLTIEQEELRGVSRTVAEIEWLLLIVVLLYLTFGGPSEEDRLPIVMALMFYGAFTLSFHYANFYKTESRWKIALETWVMIVFVTWVVWFTDKLGSPLLNAYLLVILTSALTLGKIATLLEMALIAACFIFLGDNSSAGEIMSLSYIGRLAAQLAPMLLVAYVTTMFSADIRYGLNKAKLLSETDELTSVYNRRGFAIAADPLFGQAQRYKRPASLLIIDVDRLKYVNDTFGHETGDRMLKLIAQCIGNELRATDVLARHGGDEFVALLSETPAKGAMEVSTRIKDAVAACKLEHGGRTVSISVSIGVATFPEDGQTIDALLGRADRAMYLAKQGGRNGVVKFTA